MSNLIKFYFQIPEIKMEGFDVGIPTNGGSAMNVTFVLLLSAFILHVFTSQWFQSLDLREFKAELRNLLRYGWDVFVREQNSQEAGVESTVLKSFGIADFFKDRDG